MMLDFMKKWFDKNGKSKTVAKERLRLVLVQDRIDTREESLESLKNDLIAVIGRHLSIDTDAMDVSLRRDGDQVAIVANIPVLTGAGLGNVEPKQAME
ncbi:MAG: cell division topological specificity factor MinE [Bacillota bacterium]|nr:cell division topological specificity factor MinE [Bacillota bacterium]